jgi:hypothetical protein
MMSRYLGMLRADVQAGATVDNVSVRDFLFA